MKLADIEHSIDVARSDLERVQILEKALPCLRGKDVRTAMIILANLYALLGKYGKAATLYELAGMSEEAVKARVRRV
ncbi:MAG: hypothetical protein QW165_03595 [Candidatus Woesearchaeota archaeon]